MGHITFAGHVEGPIELAFDLAVDPVRMRECMPWITRVWDIRGSQAAVGDSYRFRDTMLGRDAEGVAEVQAADRPFLQSTVSRYDNGVIARWTMRFTPTAGGTDITNDVDYELPAGLAGRIADRLVFHRFIERRLRRGAARFEQQVRADLARANAA